MGETMPRRAFRTNVSVHIILMLALFGLSVLSASNGAHRAKRFDRWTAPVNLGDTVNSPYSEFLPTLSRNGTSLYFVSDRPGSLGGEDLWVSRRKNRNAPWGTPVNLGAAVNTAFNERSPELSRDGHLLFFATNRPGGLGDFDIWVAWRAHTHDDFSWQPAVNLGSGVNSVAGDFGPSYIDNGKIGIPSLYFSSTRPGGLGSADIYRSEMSRDGSFAAATPVTELNSPQGDFRPSIRGDGLEIVFDSNRPGPPDVAGIGLRDLWVSRRSALSAPWSIPKNLGPSVNSPFNDYLAMLSSDGRTLVMVSDRPGGFGGNDLYIATRSRR
jgi:Tol biopolymer transport system component